MDGHRQGSVAGRGGGFRGIAVQRLEPVVAGRPVGIARFDAAVVRNDGEPVEPGAEVPDPRRQAGLGDRGPDAGMFGEIRQLLAAGPRIRRHRDRADARQRVPGEQVFRRVLQIDHDPVALPHAAARQTVGEPGGIVGKGGIGPGLRRAVERRPGQEGALCRGSAPVSAAGRPDRGRHRGYIGFAVHRRSISPPPRSPASAGRVRK